MKEPVIYIDPQRALDLDWDLVLQKLYYQPRGYYRIAKKLLNVCKQDGYNFLLDDIKE